MKIRFVEKPPGRDYAVGHVEEFNGPVPEGYAQKYINRGWAVDVTDEKPVKKSEALKPEVKAEPKASVILPAAKPVTASFVSRG